VLCTQQQRARIVQQQHRHHFTLKLRKKKKLHVLGAGDFKDIREKPFPWQL